MRATRQLHLWPTHWCSSTRPMAKIGPEAISGLDAAGWIAEGALIAVETGRTEDLKLPEGFTLEDQRRYGRAKISLATKK